MKRTPTRTLDPCCPGAATLRRALAALHGAAVRPATLANVRRQLTNGHVRFCARCRDFRGGV